MQETQNIKDLWICIKCGRCGYYKFFLHSTRLTKMDGCSGKVVKYRTWLNYINMEDEAFSKLKPRKARSHNSGLKKDRHQ